MVLLQDFVGGGVVRLVHYAVAVQVGEGNPGISEVVLDGVFITSHPAIVANPAFGVVDGLSHPVPVFYAADVVLGVGG